MASVWFQNGQRIIAQVLEWLQTTAFNYTADRIEDYSQFGICKLELGEFFTIPGTNNTPTTPSVSIGNGVAYDVNNLRIIVSDTNTYNAANPSNTTNDGTGNFVSTPQSTGSQNIPLTVNSQNYIWIQYVVTVDTTQYTLQDITLAKQFYERTDGYEFLVTTVNVAPSASAIFIAGINLTGSGVVSSTTISQLGRVYTGNLPYRNYIQTVATNLLDRTTVYTTGNQQYFLDDHIKAVGSGTVSPTNPHGLGPTDIGLTGASTIQFHQDNLHSPGIVGPSTTVQAQIISIVPGFDQVLVNPIPAGGVVTSNGISLTNTDIPLSTTLQFTSSDAPGTWYIYVDIINKIVSRSQTNLIATPNPNQYLIYTVFYTLALPSNGHLTLLTDFRVFGNIATRELQAGSVTGIKINPSALGAGLSKDGGSNVQVNVDGTSIIVNGSNDLEVIGSGIAGAGLIASGSVLNVNPDNSTINIVSNKVQVANNGITGLQINPSVAGNGLAGGGGSPLSVNVDNSTIQISSDILHVGAGSISSGQINDGGVSVRQSFTLSFNGGVSTGGGNWEVKASTGFSVPSSSQPVLVQWYWTGTSSGAGSQGVGLAIDNVPLATVPAPSSWPGGFGLSASTPVPPINTINASLLVASGTSHTLQMYLHGGPGTGGGSMNTTIHVTLMFTYR